MKIGYLFSGQGQQFDGMGQDLYQTEPRYRAVVDRASDILGHDLANESVFDDPDNVQTSIVTMEAGIAAILADELPSIAGMTGLSLGEYSALLAANAWSLETTLPLVRDRAQMMAMAGAQEPGTMAAVLKTNAQQVEAVCSELRQAGHRVYPANYNTDHQIVIGGDEAGVQLATEQLHNAGIKRIVPLKMTVASHTPLMKLASVQLGQRLTDVAVKQPTTAVFSNTTGQTFDQDSIKQTLAHQLIQPTRFDQCLHQLADLHCDVLIEIGPGTALTKFAKKTLPDAKVVNVESVETLDALRRVMKEVAYG